MNSNYRSQESQQGNQRWFTRSSATKRTFLNFWLLACGALTTYDLQLIGRVTVAELMVAISLPILFFFRKVEFWNRNFWICAGVLGIMFFFTIIGDFFNGFVFELSARALARPVFMFGFMLFFMLVFERSPKSVVWFTTGLLVAGLIKYFRPSQFESESSIDVLSYSGIVFRVEPLIWGFVLTMTVWFWLKNRFLVITSIFLALAILILIGSSRSSLICYILSLGVMVFLFTFQRKQNMHFILSRIHVIGLATVVAFGLSLTYAAYIYFAPRGFLGEDQQNKFEEQSTTTFGNSPLGFVLAGRPQVYGAILGIMERPVIGFGSWRHDLTSQYTYDAISQVGTDPRMIDIMSRSGIISAAGHSVFLQAWLENGLVPALCWIAIAFICIKVFWINIRFNNIFTAFFVLMFIGFFWNFLFSPPPVYFRYTVGLFLAFYIVFLDRRHPLRNFIELQ